MSRLRIFEDTAPQAVLRVTRDHDAIARSVDLDDAAVLAQRLRGLAVYAQRHALERLAP